MFKQTYYQLLAGVLAGSMFFSGDLLRAQEQQPATGDSATHAQSSTTNPAQGNPASNGRSNSTESAAGWHARQGSLYKRNWGVDILGVKSVSSGYMLRFSYRILDVDKAKAFNDKKAKPYLVNEETGEKLFIPEMEKVGQLRQTAPPQAGRIYWMVFANPNKSLKAGNHVDVVIGKVRVDGLVIE